MSWQSRYSPPNPSAWHGHSDTPKNACFFQQIEGIDLLHDIPEAKPPLTFALIGFRCDEGVKRDGGRTGAAEAPFIIRQRLANLPFQNSAIHCYDVGDIICLDHDLEASQKALGQVVTLLLEKNIRTITMGGGREVAYGNYQGIAQFVEPHKKLGIINFDAHFDLQPMKSMYGSSKTAFYQIAQSLKNEKRHFDLNCIGIQHAGNIRQSFTTAKKYGTNIILADELHQGMQVKCFDFIDRIVDENDFIYTSLSLDVFSPAYAPGVSAIQPLGLSPWQVIPLLRQAAASKKVICYDIAELVPRFDIDHRTAKLAATLIYEIIHHHHLD